MRAITNYIIEKLQISGNRPKPLVNFDMYTLIDRIKAYRNYAPGRTPGEYLFLQSYMNDGKDFIVQDGEYKGYYIWYTPYDTTRFPDQKEYIWFKIKKKKFDYMQISIVARDINELIDILGVDAANNLYTFLCKQTHYNIDEKLQISRHKQPINSDITFEIFFKALRNLANPIITLKDTPLGKTVKMKSLAGFNTVFTKCVGKTIDDIYVLDQKLIACDLNRKTDGIKTIKITNTEQLYSIFNEEELEVLLEYMKGRRQSGIVL